MYYDLNDDNFVLYAMKNYDNPSCKGVEEFKDDLKKFSYLIRLFKKFQPGSGLKERLILNHLIVLYNVFPHRECTRILCFKLYEYLSYLKPFLVQLNYWPDKVDPIGINSTIIIGSDISMDQNIVDTLRKI